MLISKRIQRGVTLVEAMIALLVISIGLLGIAALQLTAMSQNTSAMNHSQAVWLAYTMSDRIRANISEFDNYNGIDTDDGYNGNCVDNPCSTLDMVTADAADWETMVQALPKGRGRVTLANGVLTVIVHWDDEGTDAGGLGCDPNDADDLTCYRVAVTQ